MGRGRWSTASPEIRTYIGITDERSLGRLGRHHRRARVSRGWGGRRQLKLTSSPPLRQRLSTELSNSPPSQTNTTVTATLGALPSRCQRFGLTHFRELRLKFKDVLKVLDVSILNLSPQDANRSHHTLQTTSHNARYQSKIETREFLFGSFSLALGRYPLAKENEERTNMSMEEDVETTEVYRMYAEYCRRIYLLDPSWYGFRVEFSCFSC